MGTAQAVGGAGVGCDALQSLTGFVMLINPWNIAMDWERLLGNQLS